MKSLRMPPPQRRPPLPPTALKGKKSVTFKSSLIKSPTPASQRRPLPPASSLQFSIPPISASPPQRRPLPPTALKGKKSVTFKSSLTKSPTPASQRRPLPPASSSQLSKPPISAPPQRRPPTALKGKKSVTFKSSLTKPPTPASQRRPLPPAASSQLSIPPISAASQRQRRPLPPTALKEKKSVTKPPTPASQRRCNNFSLASSRSSTAYHPYHRPTSSLPPTAPHVVVVCNNLFVNNKYITTKS